jgi:hypothetical protein
MKPLVKYCESAVAALNAQYEMSKLLQHGGSAGAVRERLIQDFMIAHLPEMTTVASGFILDFNNQRSNQQDLVLVLKSMPKIPFASGHGLIFQEGVVATCEIRTDTSSFVLDAVANNIQSVKRLEPSSLGGMMLGELGWPMYRIFAMVVTYNGRELSMVNEKLQAMPEDAQPDVYLDLSRGVLIKNQSPFTRDGVSDVYWSDGEVGRALARVLAMLSTITSRIVMRDVKWEKYIDD